MSHLKVPFGTKHLDGVLSVPAALNAAHTAVVLTHGAGGDMNFRQLKSLAHCLAAEGFICLRFTCKALNLGYRVRAFRAVYDYLKSLQRFPITDIYLGGRSMGCRAAVTLARQLSDESEDTVQGVLCLSFPLHPPGQTHAHQQRSEDLRLLPERMRVLFVSGTEDNMCDRVRKAKMKALVEVLWIQRGSHGLTVKAKAKEAVMDEVNLKVVTWLNGTRNRD
uniref:Testis expressed 30 n=2 Tax=Salarias fasciatus TaxID=181472 RepID=A0A672GJS4_SALFA